MSWKFAGRSPAENENQVQLDVFDSISGESVISAFFGGGSTVLTIGGIRTGAPIKAIGGDGMTYC